MNKETLKDYLCWLIDKDYIKNFDRTNTSVRINCETNKSVIVNCEYIFEFYQEKREQKINEILK
jgi:uncharacterized protein YtpQ (UPF0354 family)